MEYRPVSQPEQNLSQKITHLVKNSAQGFLYFATKIGLNPFGAIVNINAQKGKIKRIPRKSEGKELTPEQLDAYNLSDSLKFKWHREGRRWMIVNDTSREPPRNLPPDN